MVWTALKNLLNEPWATQRLTETMRTSVFCTIHDIIGVISRVRDSLCSNVHELNIDYFFKTAQFVMSMFVMLSNNEC